MTDDTAIEIMATGLRFPEGPIAMADGSVVLVEIARQTLSRVDPDGSVEVIAHLGGGPNGAAIGPDGKVYVCNNGGMKFHEARGKTYPGHMPDGYTGGSIQRVDLDTGEFEVLYTHAGDVQLRGPNDLVFDRDGGFWFTDHGKLQDRLQDRTGVFYAKADGSHIQEMIFPMEGPNGIGLSPAEDEVYIAETPTGQVWAYELAGPGELLGQRRDKPDGGRLLGGRDGYFMFDSLAIDADGNVCVATIIDGGITILSPTGGEPGFVPMPDRVTTNICFGGTDLRTAYITLSSTGQLAKVPWEVAGLGLNYNG
ncbi:SMP-30/gluconolactonase/LRE family protein [Acidimicrobiales bacterium]|nr:SMP-30/gluconolactonase/LRE family protein [bacterium]MDB2391924.1 SMP-30/gluconolactonase/LRE family protein [Acidimicrobiaceae bacterium]MDB9845315.1 SMP-30/gluconolactonase/LRE family protein [Acidimicrobiales bacterium]